MQYLVLLKEILIKIISFFKLKKAPNPFIIIVSNSNNVGISVNLENK